MSNEILDLSKVKIKKAIEYFSKTPIQKEDDPRFQALTELKITFKDIDNLRLPIGLSSCVYCGLKKAYANSQEESMILEIVSLLQNGQRPKPTSPEAYKILAYCIKTISQSLKNTKIDSINTTSNKSKLNNELATNDEEGVTPLQFLQDLGQIAADLIGGRIILPLTTQNKKDYPSLSQSLKLSPEEVEKFGQPTVAENISRLNILLNFGQTPLMPWDTEEEEEFSFYSISDFRPIPISLSREKEKA